MRVRQDIVRATIRRAATVRFKPSVAAKSIAEDSRERYTRPAQREARYARLLAQTREPAEAHLTLERLLGGNDLVGIAYLALGTQVSRSVCRVHLQDGPGTTVGFGTGFLVAPGVLMTNNHVIGSAAEARHSLAEFEYERDVLGRDKPVVSFRLLIDPPPITDKALDFCLVAVDGHAAASGRPLSDFRWLPLDPTPGKAFVGEYLTIVQHPGGERKQVCVRENKLIRFDENGSTLWYQTDTVAGSSGSPVFNNSWQIVALHHSGIPKTDSHGNWLTTDGVVWDSSMDESRVAWIANEGIRISRILEFLRASHANHPLAAAVLNREQPPEVVPEEARAEPARQTDSEFRDGALSVTIPVRVTVRVGDAPPIATPGILPPRPIDRPLPAIDVAAVEAVSVDHSDLGKRPGFDPNFLGSGKLRVPLPKLSPSLQNHAAKLASGGTELKYWTYSVVMNRQRKLAFFSAVNVDASQSREKRKGDRWYTDPRIDESLQLGQEFYGEQREFEARELNPFDRGHLTRRWDAQWGTSGPLAKRNGDDSFHFTNCSPQHWKYNEGTEKWLGLEEYVIDAFASEGKRASVLNGPVFDAPLSTIKAGRVILNPEGKRHKDPTFGGVAIPKMFFKVVAGRRSGQLVAAGFILSQEDFLRRTSRIKGLEAARVNESLTDDEARLFQVPITTVEELTGLSFGPLSKVDQAAGPDLDEAIRTGSLESVPTLEALRLG